MTDPGELRARADRCVRRGEVSEALAIYRELLSRSPDDPALAERVRNLESTLDPDELQRVGRTAPAAAEPDALGPVSPEQEGERLFALGDYVGAAAAYRRALAERPDSDLIKERLGELFQLAQAAPRSSPTDRALPTDAAGKLRALLDRIASRRRVSS